MNGKTTAPTVHERLAASMRANVAMGNAIGDPRIEQLDPAAGFARVRFTVRPEFCHSNASIAQGGFVTAWLDAAMTYAVFARTDLAYAVASLEIKVSFLERVGPGSVIAEGRVRRLGRSVAFLDGELFAPDGKLLATASSTARLVAN